MEPVLPSMNGEAFALSTSLSTQFVYCSKRNSSARKLFIASPEMGGGDQRAKVLSKKPSVIAARCAQVKCTERVHKTFPVVFSIFCVVSPHEMKEEIETKHFEHNLRF